MNRKKLDIYGMIYKHIGDSFLLYLYDSKTFSYTYQILNVPISSFILSDEEKSSFFYLKNQLVNIYFDQNELLFIPSKRLKGS